MSIVGLKAYVNENALVRYRNLDTRIYRVPTLDNIEIEGRIRNEENVGVYYFYPIKFNVELKSGHLADLGDIFLTPLEGATSWSTIDITSDMEVEYYPEVPIPDGTESKYFIFFGLYFVDPICAITSSSVLPDILSISFTSLSNPK